MYFDYVLVFAIIVFGYMYYSAKKDESHTISIPMKKDEDFEILKAYVFSDALDGCYQWDNSWRLDN